MTAEAQMKAIVQTLFQLIVQNFDHQGAPTFEAMKRDMCVESIFYISTCTYSSR